VRQEGKGMTQKVTARWPIKIGDTLIPSGEAGRTATLEEVQAVWPGIAYEAGSDQVAVIFRDFKPCIVLTKQVIF